MRNLLFILLPVFVLGCSRNGDDVSKTRTGEPCGEAVQVTAKSFSTAESDPFSITSASIKGDCLTVTVGASGCSSDWEKVEVLHGISLTADGLPQNRLKIVLSNKTGDCATSFSKTLQFDLYPLRQKGTNKLTILLYGYDKTLEYAYGN
ncbi:hypothetical protein [Niabella ginsengisoli]|uniref:Lipoprotein n=1 Tax=Niabella ginsengisoli TaxID=522298 RepID=A0ABS9SQC6_9BACT|nr:hypothetical protein [Niabella ginsengisoli]MCH5600564.1 hypothetical protein [Niabella ginsengisoli]